MDRKEFLKTACFSGLCACTASAFLAQKASAQEQEDWRLGFSKSRYTMLMNILSSKLDASEFDEIIQELGRGCAGSITVLQEYKGDLDGYVKMLKERWNEDATVDKAKGIISVSSEERTECFCPLIDTHNVSEQVCKCSLGWQKQAFETVLQKPVEVKIKESIIRGGGKCIFEIFYEV